jgi:hypothetical protein
MLYLATWISCIQKDNAPNLGSNSIVLKNLIAQFDSNDNSSKTLNLQFGYPKTQT